MAGINPIARIDKLHACIAVDNLDDTIDWYSTNLGFNPIQHFDIPEYSVRIVYLESNGVEIELIERKGMVKIKRPDPPMEYIQAQGITQLSFRVSNFEEVVNQVKHRNISIVFGPVDADQLKLKAFFIRDNEGNLIEFINRY